MLRNLRRTRPADGGEDGTDDDADRRARGGATRRRRRTVVAIALGAAVVSAAGLGAATLVKSPEQVAADTKPPAASPLTAPVVQRVLANTTVLRGVFSAGQTYAVQPATVAASTGGPGGGTPIVSALKVAAGDRVDGKAVLAEVSGRPVFVLPGAIPAYRDMQPGESGDDIAQLQSVLKDLGISTGGDTKGSFGAGTKAAVTKLYQQLGYGVPVTGETTAAAVRTAQQAVQQQEQAVQDLQSRRAAPEPGDASGTPKADGAGTGGGGDSATQLARAKGLLDQKRQELAQAQAKDGPQVPLSEVLFLPSLPARVHAVSAKVGDKVTAPILSLTAGGLGLTGHLLPSDAPLVKQGMKVTVLSESTGVQLSATVGGVGALVTPGGNAAPGAGTAGQAGQGADAAGGARQDPYVPVSITPDEPWNPALEGQDVRITIVEAATAGEVLAVPASAISSSVDGRTTVTVVAADGSRRPVEVTAGVVADNYVQVTAKNGDLRPGDPVLVGVGQAGAGGGAAPGGGFQGGAG